jgi:hypothetical protein
VRLREVGGNANLLASLDRDLVDALAEANPEVQGAVAVWAAHQACDMARISERPWIAPALVALDRAEPLPHPFHDKNAAFAKLLGGQGDVRTVVTLGPLGEKSASARVSSMQISKPHAALPAIFAVVEADPLHAACDALWAAVVTAGPDHPAILTKCRQLIAGQSAERGSRSKLR